MSTKGMIVRVPDQDPLVFFYLYLEELLGWKENNVISQAARNFKTVLGNLVVVKK